MAGKWMTYAELGEELGITPEAARQRATRKRWRRTVHNDGRARVMVEEDELDLVRASPRRSPRQAPDDRQDVPPLNTPDNPQNESTIKALEDHIATLKEAVEKAEALADQRGVELEAERQRVHDLHIRLLEITADRERGLLARIGKALTSR